MSEPLITCRNILLSASKTGSGLLSREQRLGGDLPTVQPASGMKVA